MPRPGDQPKYRWGVPNPYWTGPSQAAGAMSADVTSGYRDDFASESNEPDVESKFKSIADAEYQRIIAEPMEHTMVDVNGREFDHLNDYVSIAEGEEHLLRWATGTGEESIEPLLEEPEIADRMEEYSSLEEAMEDEDFIDLLREYGFSTPPDQAAEMIEEMDPDVIIKNWGLDERIEFVKGSGVTGSGEMEIGDPDSEEDAEAIEMINSYGITGTYEEHEPVYRDHVTGENWESIPYAVTLTCDGRSEEMIFYHGMAVNHPPTVASLVSEYLSTDNIAEIGISEGELTPLDIAGELGYDMEDHRERRAAFITAEGVNKQREQFRRLLGQD